VYGKIQKSKRNIIKELTLCIMAFAIFSLAGCSHKEKEETGTPKVWAEEVQMPAIENEYQTSAGIKADCGNYYEIQDGIGDVYVWGKGYTLSPKKIVGSVHLNNMFKACKDVLFT
jgi:hypothetical protein